MSKVKKNVKPQTPDETSSEFKNFVNLTQQLFKVPKGKLDDKDTINGHDKNNSKDTINDKKNKGVKK